MTTAEQLEREAQIENAMNKIKENCKKDDARRIKERANNAEFNRELRQIQREYDYE